MPKRLITAEDLLRLNFVGDPQISPDGHRILFSKKIVDADKNKYVANLFTVDLDGHVQQWTSGTGGAGNGRWSPDGSQIAFISGREDRQGQIFLISTTGGEARKLSSLPEGSVSNLIWSPDGKHIAFYFRETGEEWTEKARKEREGNGKSTPPRVINTPYYRLDGDGYFMDQRHAIYVIDTETGEHKKVYSECPMGWYELDWSPDSKELIVGHPRGKRPMFDDLDIKLVRIDLEGQAWEVEGIPFGPKELVRWSPDGKWIAYIGNEHRTGWGCMNSRLYIVPAEGGEGRCLTPDDDYCLGVGTLSDSKEMGSDGIVVWSPDSKAIYLSIGHHGATQIAYCDIEKGGVNLLTKGDHAMQVGNISRDGEKLACIYGTTMKPNEVGVYDLAKHAEEPDVLTHFNKDFCEEIKLSEPEEIWLESSDGAKVHAWVMYPTEYLAPRRYPAVLQVHGGPHAQYGWAFFHEMQLLAAEGYVVVYSNPRGSKGYGEDHCSAIKGSWGDRDWEDIQAVMRWMQHQPYIHPGQIGIAGGSYGGYMTNWAVSHTNDFRAAITDRCVSNLVSFGGNSDFIQTEDQYWSGVYFGDITDLWEQSPIKYFKNVKTPMLVIHSEGDLRCNIEQGEQVYAALCQLGVDCRFVRYPQNTFHGLSRSGPPDLRLHRLGEITSWWDKYLKVS